MQETSYSLYLLCIILKTKILKEKQKALPYYYLKKTKKETNKNIQSKDHSESIYNPSSFPPAC